MHNCVHVCTHKRVPRCKIVFLCTSLTNSTSQRQGSSQVVSNCPWDEDTNVAWMEVEWQSPGFWHRLVLAASLWKSWLALLTPSSCAIWNLCPELNGAFLNLFIPNLAQAAFICDFGVFCCIYPMIQLAVENYPSYSLVPVIKMFCSSPEKWTAYPCAQKWIYHVEHFSGVSRGSTLPLCKTERPFLPSALYPPTLSPHLSPGSDRNRN